MPDSTHSLLLSPDRRVEVCFALGEWRVGPATLAGGAAGRTSDAPLWQVSFAGRTMLRPSLLGLALRGPASLTDGFEVVGVVRRRRRRSWQPASGDAATLVDHYNEMVMRLRECAAPNRRLDVIFRCSNQGVAARVRVLRQRGLARVAPTGAGAVFRFPKDTLAWVDAGGFRKEALDALGAPCALPLLLNYAHGKLACLLQAGGAALRLQPARDGLAVLPAGAPVEFATPCESPWLVLLLGDTPCDLAQNSGFLLNLSPPDAVVPTPWLFGALGEGGTATPAHRRAIELICGAGAARWDETRYLRGETGSFVVAARRLGATWQVGGITGADGRVMTVRLEDFLGTRAKGTYALEIIRDPLPGETADGGMVRETFRGVDCRDKPRLELPPRGGFLLRLEPE